MSATINVAAAKLIPEIEGYLFERSDPYRYFLARRPWTVDEQKKLDDLMEAGKTAAEIATAQRTPLHLFAVTAPLQKTTEAIRRLVETG
jgi:hypothetical protein